MKPQPPAILTGNRIILKRLLPEDVSRFYKMVTRNMDHIKENFPRMTDACKTWNDTDKYIASSNLEWNEKKQFRYIIMRQGLPEAIGYLSIKNIDWSIPKCELGYFVDSQFEGMGIATEALQMAAAKCFETLHMEKIFLRVIKGNVASKKVAEKNKFRLEGVLNREFRNHEHELRDVWYFGLLNPHGTEVKN